MRLTTGEPAQDFDRIVGALTPMVEVKHVRLFASHIVIGKACIALQHHCDDRQAGSVEAGSS